jgi:isopenicillin N synthase-like dioxygenase
MTQGERIMATVLPSIDLQPFITGSESGQLATPQAIALACEEVGFFKIRGHGLPQTLIDTAFATASDFFGQPQAIKDRSRPPKSASARGYHALLTKNLAKTLGYDNPPDLREQFYIGPLVSRAAEFAHIPGASELYAENIWPQAPAIYREVFSSYYTALEKLGGTLMRLFALALGVDQGFFDGKIDRHFSTLPANHYPEPIGDPLPNQVRAGEHTDFGSLTILAVSERSGGLQVKLKDGSWLDVTSEPDEFIVNIGDMMQRWTNDRWKSNLHRVVNPAAGQRKGSRRMSIGYFLHPNYDTEIACLPTCTDPDQPPRHVPVRAGDMMRQKLEARAA